MALTAEKIEIQRQWDRDPCGAITAQGKSPEAPDYYRAVRDYRYNVYGPWFDQVVRFDDWRGKDILEVGVGLGSDHLRFARNGNRMVGLDLSREHLRHTKQHLGMEGWSTTGIYGDAELMMFKDASFDLVYAFGVLHHTPNAEAAVTEVHRVLRPGGSAVIGLYHMNSWFFWFNTVLANGLVRGGLWMKGFRVLLSEIEYRERPDSATPLVKVYTRRQVRRLLHQFRNVKLNVCHVEPSHFSRLACLFRGWTRDQLERRLGRGGWYIVVHALK